MSCDIGYAIAGHVPALMQVVTEDIHNSYNMNMQRTRCLNTAVMIMYLLLGSEALPHTLACDVDSVYKVVQERRQKRDAAAGPPDLSVGMGAQTAAALRDAALVADRDARVLYYVMITSSHMQGPAGKQVRDFPGHVFVIERLPRNTFNFYQSYIGDYDLEGQIRASGGTLSLGGKKMREILDGLVYLAGAETWDAECTRIWRLITRADAAEFEGCSKAGIHMCYRRVQTMNCMLKLRAYLQLKRGEILAATSADPRSLGQLYPSDLVAVKRYSSDPSDRRIQEDEPLTNRQVLDHLNAMLEKIEE